MTKVGRLRCTAQQILLLLAVLLLWTLVSITRNESQAPSVNLVIASTLAQDYSWTSNIRIPNLRIIPFVADNPNSTYHPPLNKGREAMIYLTYIYQFYGSLPDISIFVHADDESWHVDSIFGRSTAYTLNHLDLNEVLQRQYLNLHVDWKHACPAWINTSSTSNENESKFEQPFMAAAFTANFPNETVPEILAQPCCSQFAVTREAILSVPREQYQHQINWLLRSAFSDELTGRMWEHMWQFLFLKEVVVCPLEYKALCAGWHICFGSQEEMNGWKKLAKDREDLHPTLGRIDPPHGKIEAMDMELRAWKERAMKRGRSKAERARIVGDLWGEHE
ncbi:hypothetical protein LSUE1_G000680 [Lachnellula suecica]|uniref:Uncharacterized protein n=1 Tax=Lachnellula suecica TaxID=602035 RepID=A0A8T9CM09_9HELO|nr:hypothetical protein LSUE1_G000680 [Lachnellula suecica]